MQTLSDYYERDHQPEVSNEILAVVVNITTGLETIIEIEERSHIIQLKFDLMLEWYENRAKYQNLKNNSALNILSNSELQSLWIPFIIFKVKNKSSLELIENVEPRTLT